MMDLSSCEKKMSERKKKFQATTSFFDN